MPLESRISGDWIELRNASRNPDQLEELLGIAGHAPLALELSAAVEAGVVEVKRRRIGKLFEVLEDIKYRSKSLGQLEVQADALASLIFAVFTERGFLEGTIPLPSEESASGADLSGDVKQQEIRSIIEDVQQIVATDPSARMAAGIKNILLQVSKYRQEMEDLKRLTANAPDEKKKAYVQNFQRSFADIFASIRKNYAEYLREREAMKQSAEPGVLDGLECKPLVRHLTSEAETLSSFRSTILYVRKEQVRVIEILTRLANRKEELFTMLDRELALFAEVQAAAGRRVEDKGVALSKRIGQELASYLSERSRPATPEGEAAAEPGGAKSP